MLRLQSGTRKGRCQAASQFDAAAALSVLRPSIMYVCPRLDRDESSDGSILIEVLFYFEVHLEALRIGS